MSDAPVAARPSRRRFLARGGALVVAFSLAPATVRAQAAHADEKLPGSLAQTPALDSWIRVEANGAITVFTGKVELGQGIRTALLQIAAEELAVAPSRIEMVTADTARTPNEGYTAGSQSMKNSGTAIRHAAAQVRAIVASLASERLGIPVQRLVVADGVVRADDGRELRYGELVSGQVLHVDARPQSAFVAATARKYIGKPFARIDIPAKVSGGVTYVQDLRLPAMLHARVVRPSAVGSHLVALDSREVERMPGVVKIVRDGDYLGVLAEREWQAVGAMHALAKAAKWSAPPDVASRADVFAALLHAPADETIIAGGAAPASEPAWTTSATYRRPFQMHASIGPSCAVGHFVDGTLTVWTHSQGVYPLRNAIAELVKLPPDRVRCVHMEGSGCYGHNGADDAAGDAALLALAMPGRPVRVQWMREQEHAWEPYGSAMIATAKAALDANGAIVAWQYDVWSNTHSSRPGKAGELAPSWLIATPFTPSLPQPIPQPDGGGDRNAIPYYDIANPRVVHHFVREMPLRVSALRSLGAYHNVFAIESFIDELARLAKADPIEYRLRQLRDPRAQAAVRLAAERFDWKRFARTSGRGRGFAFARYKNYAAYCAIALEVDVDRDSGRVHVVRAVSAVDSGEAVNPDGIRNQIEGGILQSLSWSLFEAVAFDRAHVSSRDFAAYPIMRFAAVPSVVDVHVIDQPGAPFLGTGEAAQGPAAAALANAVFDATGARIRDLPLARARVRAALHA
jgi:CO/xanthine dehydrogenase Mo-binding subunit